MSVFIVSVANDGESAGAQPGIFQGRIRKNRLTFCLQRIKESSRRKKFQTFSLLDTLETVEKFNPQMNTIRLVFSKIGALISLFKTSKCNLFPPSRLLYPWGDYCDIGDPIGRRSKMASLWILSKKYESKNLWKNSPVSDTWS